VRLAIQARREKAKELTDVGMSERQAAKALGAAELDETPGLVRPITLNMIGYVLASDRAVAPSLDAGLLVRRYIFGILMFRMN
jgi:hypothetical protein